MPSIIYWGNGFSSEAELNRMYSWSQSVYSGCVVPAVSAEPTVPFTRVYKYYSLCVASYLAVTQRSSCDLWESDSTRFLFPLKIPAKSAFHRAPEGLILWP